MNLQNSEKCIKRCFDLAIKGYRSSGMNPCVGSILVFEDRIIGEGYYKEFGGLHAEVNCINSVRSEDVHLINKSTLYVSLEPCSIQGKTPPCSNFIIKHKIPKVIISVKDPNPEINGRGILQLKNVGIEVHSGILEKQGLEIISKFTTNILKKRPFISLKWAQSKDFYSGKKDKSIWITNEYSRILAHKLRAKFEAILIGPNSVNLDDPSLDNRHYQLSPDKNEQPVKLVIDRNQIINKDSILFYSGQPVHIFTTTHDYKNPNPELVRIHALDNWSWQEVLSICFELNFSSILIEGGPTIHKSLIKEGLWDEAHVLSSNINLEEGISAPRVTGVVLERLSLGNDSYVRINPK